MNLQDFDIIELFAGDRSIGKAAEKKGLSAFSVDWDPFPGIHLQIDIKDLTPAMLPKKPKALWASFDCKTYTIAACSTHRHKGPDKLPKTPYAIQCDNVNQNVLSLINYYLTHDPNFVYFIENPRGNLRKMPWMQLLPRQTVWYCQYNDERAKPTDIWTNSKTWKPRPMCKNYRYDADGNIIDRHCHHESARRGAKTGTQGRKNSFERSKIPSELCDEIIDSLLM